MTRNGAGVKGHNEGNVHICVVGGVNESSKSVDNYTTDQYDSLRFVISELSSRFGIREECVIGHRDWPDVAKDCPCFDVQAKLQEWKQ